MSASPLLRIPRNLSSFARPHLLTQTPLRSISTTPRRFNGPGDAAQHQKNAQLDRKKMDRSPNEYSQQGDQSGAATDAAFDPNVTDPQEAKKKAGEGNSVNPLEDSPANPDISQGTDEEAGGSKPKLSESSGGR
jgi:hypothetical protein